MTRNTCKSAKIFAIFATLLLTLAPTMASATIFEVSLDFEADNFVDLEGDNTISPVTSLGGNFTFLLDDSLAAGVNHVFALGTVSMAPVGDSIFDPSNTGGFFKLNGDKSLDQIHLFGLIEPSNAPGGSDDFVLSTWQNAGIDRFRYTVDEDDNAVFWDFDADITVTLTPVPAPATLFLFAIALSGLGLRRLFTVRQ